MNRAEYKNLLTQELEQMEQCRKTGTLRWSDKAADEAMRRSDVSLYIDIVRERQEAEKQLDRSEIEIVKIEMGLSL